MLELDCFPQATCFICFAGQVQHAKVAFVASNRTAGTMRRPIQFVLFALEQSNDGNGITNPKSNKNQTRINGNRNECE